MLGFLCFRRFLARLVEMDGSAFQGAAQPLILIACRCNVSVGFAYYSLE